MDYGLFITSQCLFKSYGIEGRYNSEFGAGKKEVPTRGQVLKLKY